MSTMPVDMPPSAEMTYEQFGRRFFEVAVTEDRVGGAIAAIAGDEFEMGPMAQGPGKVAKVTAKVRVQEPRLTRDVGDQITFAIRIPLEIDLVVDLRIDKPKFMVFGEIALRATARAVEPLLLILDVEKPRPSDISIHVTSKSLRGELVRILGNIDAEIRRFIAAHVAGEIDSPASQKAKVIDVADSIDGAWSV
ncbi:hypothetical protein [Mycolicibacterium gadium]|uniref:Uncharacterized protein n=1 Tax=Mycolicibacterium gadium TaxID=1794 RepID=A0ABT6GQ99_MYCGU|nr:hypothetical protein [Mycolicibacterium gadium]MDG5483436.1 hypothetical protein [Mycolicibacterium gadium]